MATVQDALMHVCSIASSAINQWVKENDEQKIKASVIDELEKQKKTILYKLMGFSVNSFNGSWEIDHCNGRAGESSAGDYLKRVQADAVNDFLNKIKIPAPNKKELEQFRETYRNEMNRNLIEAMREAATSDARKLAKQLIEEVLPSGNPIEQYQELLKLIKG